MTEISIAAMPEVSTGPDRHPVYCQYQGQSRPQGAYIALDCRDGNVWASYNPEIGDAVPLDVWNGHVLRFAISPYADGAWINGTMEALRPTFAAILAGYDPYWDGGNSVARFTDEASDATWSADSLAYEHEECDSECSVCWLEDE
jgi:hypothetical protein